MDDRHTERLLQQAFSGLRISSPDQAFAGRVMRAIESDQFIATDSRRPLIIGAAMLLGFVVALASVTGLDWNFLESINATLLRSFEQWRGLSIWPGVVLIPLFWFLLVDA